MNQELLNQIEEAYRTGNTISLRVDGVLDTELVKDIHELYIGGYLHLPKYCRAFGYSRAKNIKVVFKRLGLKILNMKQTHEIYRSVIQSSKWETNLERYGVENPTQSPMIREKVKQTNLERYGVENVFRSPDTREKIKRHILERYGVENPSQSPEIRKKIEQTNLERYGSTSHLGSPEIRKKIEQTNLERYGVENPFQSHEIKEIIKQTNLKKFGVEYVSQSPEIRDKAKETNLKKFGVEYVSQSPEIREKITKTNLERYGVENPGQSLVVRERMKRTNLERYGVENPSQFPEIRQMISQRLKTEEVQDKIKSTNMRRYGFEYASQSPEIKERVRSTRKSNDSRYAKLEELVEYEQDKVHTFVFKNYPYNHSKILRRYGLYQENLSTPEAAIREILEKHKIEYIFRHRPKFMGGKELDFYIPNRRASNNPVTGKPGKPVAIEVNGLYWHSYPKKDKYYHQDKHLRCRSEGIQLLSFTEDQILDRLEIIESMILHKLGKTPYRLYAKNCTIRELRTQQAKDFLENNHLHGFSNASVYLGLEYQGKLVHVMSFGNNRFKRSNHPELIRSASLRFHSVAGGFQRLLKYYKRSHGVNLVESYVDFNISNGQSYKLASKGLGDLGDLGNSSVRETVRETPRDNLTEPDLWFVFRGKRYRRQMFMKHNLHKIFEDFPKRSEDGYKDINSSEYLRDRGVLEYYGAGNLKYLI